MSISQYQEWLFGWRMYANGVSIERCATETQKRGWWAANRAEAWATVQ